ncbi:MAG: hypothetical protein GX893_06135 [Firmicutes bacterium]|nr:hypothetical protein [Bacillota bacterium]
MKSRILLSMLVIALAALMIGGATMAWFTDSAEAGPQEFTAGTLLIDIENWDHATAETINLDILNPGDEFSFTFDVKNSGSKRFYYKLGICWQDIAGIERGIDFGDRTDYGTAALSEIVKFTIRDAETGKVIYSGLLGEYEKPLFFDEISEELASGDINSYVVECELPKEAGNQYQGSKMSIAILAAARQVHDEAEYGKVVCPIHQDEYVVP